METLKTFNISRSPAYLNEFVFFEFMERINSKLDTLSNDLEGNIQESCGFAGYLIDIFTINFLNLCA